MITHFKNKCISLSKSRLFNESEGLVPAVCLTKVLQNQSVPITLKNSVNYKNKIQTKKEFEKFESLLPVKEDSEEAEESSSAQLTITPKIVYIPAPIEDSSTDEICFSIEKYVDSTGSSMSFEKGQKFKVEHLCACLFCINYVTRKSFFNLGANERVL